MKTKITIVDVGHGNSTVIEDDLGTYVIDAGPKNGLLDFLESNGIKEINELLISHLDDDHIGGLFNILGNCNIKRIWINTDSIKATNIAEDVRWGIHQSSANFQTSLTPDSINFSSMGKLKIEVIAPSAYLASKGPGTLDREGRSITSNSISGVIRIIFNDEPLLLCAGDIDYTSYRNIIEDGKAIEARILIFPHHGGLAGTLESTIKLTEELINSVKPEIVVFSIGRNKHNNPRIEIVHKILEINKEIKIFCTQLSKTCNASEVKNNSKSLNNIYAKGRGSNSCCAGSIVISIPDVDFNPLYENHLDFITQFIKSPMCLS